MFKVIFVIALLFAVFGLATILLRRLTQNVQQLGNLREQMARNDSKLSDELRAVHSEQERLRLQLEAEKAKKSSGE